MRLKILALAIVLGSLLISGCCGYLLRGNNGPTNEPHGYGDNNGWGIGKPKMVLPDWITPGLTVYYDGYSSFKKGDQYTNPVQTVWKFHVDSVDGNTFSGNVQSIIPNTGIDPITVQWTFTDGMAHDYRFWINPADPEHSITGSNGEPYYLVGTGPYELNGKTYQATTLHSSVEGTGADFTIVYETDTGLILAQSMKYPSQEVYTFFNHMGNE